ncbi:MAG: pyridoxamine 5'-phosphate oxidase family protein [Alphaproteobacteria bacterium]|jgi:hypothetical protein
MTTTEREALLKQPRVGVLSIGETARGPLSNPVWYDYTPGGDVWFMTQKTARKGRLLQLGVRVSLLVQETERPYQYVSVEGPVSEIVAGDLRRDLQPMAQRYLGVQGGVEYADALAEKYAQGNAIKVFIRPERWLSVDYSKRPTL